MALAITPTTFVAILSGYFFGLAGLGGIMIAYPVAAFIGTTNDPVACPQAGSALKTPGIADGIVGDGASGRNEPG